MSASGDMTKANAFLVKRSVAAPGEFPFRLDEQERETQQVAWLRGHASYLNTGLVGYLAAAGIVARGVIVNGLILAPLFLVAGLGVALLSVTGWGFKVALSLLIIAVAWVLASPVLSRIWHVASTRTAAKPGSPITRRKLERGLGLLILLLGLTAAAEAAAHFLDTFHFWTKERGFGLNDLAALVVVGSPIFAFASRAIPRLAGARRAVAYAIVAAIGVLLPLLAVMSIADFLVFSVSGELGARLAYFAGLGLWVLMVLMVGVALAMSASRKPRFVMLTLVIVVVSVVVPIIGYQLVDRDFYSEQQLQADLAEVSFAPPQEVEPRAENDERQAAIEKLANHAVSHPPAELSDLSTVVEELRRQGEPSGLPPRAVYDGLAIADSVLRDSVLTEIEALYASAGDFDSAANLAVSLHSLVRDPQLFAIDQKIANGWLVELRDLRRSLEIGAPLFAGAEGDLAPIAVAAIAGFNGPNVESFYPLADANQQFQNTVFVGGEQIEASDVPDLPDEAPFDELAPAVSLTPNGPSLINGEVVPLLQRFPILGAARISPMEALDADMFRLVQSVSATRTELARVATFSAQFPALRNGQANRIRTLTLQESAISAALLAAVLWFYGWLTVDPNRTALHGLYRDRLATAFLVGRDPEDRGSLRVEPDHRLTDLSRYELRSVAPYHLINCAVNLQASKDLKLRDRHSDFFIFSKQFTGSEKTGFCRTSTMERVMPGLSAATAMAISAAAAAPNMGRTTKKSLTPVMVLLNARLGQWIPNPGLLDQRRARRQALGYSVDHVIEKEREDIEERWKNMGNRAERAEAGSLFGVAYSGGGIRSASLNLGITQALEQKGIFKHIDYMSTVSGGGYLGTAISVAMRVGPSIDRPSDDDDQSDVEKKPLVRLGDQPEVRSRRAQDFGAQFYWRAGPRSLFNESIGHLHEKGRLVNVSDGGHIENLAALELLRRECKYIIVGDAEMDPKHEFGGLTLLIRTARVELGAVIDINIDDLRPNEDGVCEKHFAIGTITYQPRQSDDETKPEQQTGYLLYLKSSITKTDREEVRGYRAKNSEFPHQSTADQFFDEGQFESYRQLGYCIATEPLALFKGDPKSYDAVTKWFEDLCEPEPGEQSEAVVDLTEQAEESMQL